MKKRSILILLVSALLCLSMLLAACDSGGENDTEEPSATGEAGTEEIEETEAIPEDEVIAYSSKLSEWNKYLSSVGKDNSADDDKKVYSNVDYLFDSDDVTVYEGPSKLAMYKKTEQRDYSTGFGGYYISTYNFYNIETGAKLFSTSFRDAYYEEGDNYTRKYNVKVLASTIIEVEKREGDYDSTEDRWDYVTTYTYYDNDGSKLLESENQAVVVDSTVIVDGKSYHCSNGEIVYQGSESSKYVSLSEDADLEYNGYKYYFTNDSIEVFNEVDGHGYVQCISYKLPSYISDDREIDILANGDVYIHWDELCDDNSEDYDYEMDGEKHNLWNIVLSVSTGEEKRYEVPFVIEKLMTKADTKDTGISLRGDYQYAEIRRVEDGRLANDVEFVILSNAFEETAKLPMILKNQSSLAKGIGNGKFVINVDNVAGTVTSYIVNTADGSVTRAVESSGSTVTVIDGGFIKDNKLYNDDNKLLYDFEDALGSNYQIFGGKTIMFTVKTREEIPDIDEPETETETEPETETETETDTTETETEFETETDPDGMDDGEYYYENEVYIGYIRDGQFVKQCLGTNVTVSQYNGMPLFIKTTGGTTYLYNIEGYSLNYFSNIPDVVRIFEDRILIRTVNADGTYNYYIVK